MALVQVPVVTASRVVVQSAPFAAVSSLPVSWTAGTYRRLEMHLKISGGATASILMTLAGLSAGSYYTTGERTGSAGAWVDASFAAQDAWKFDLPAFSGQPLELDANTQIATDGSGRMFTGHLAGATGQGLFLTGTSTDSTHDVTGLTLTFTVASSGWLDLIGYP